MSYPNCESGNTFHVTPNISVCIDCGKMFSSEEEE